MTTLVALVRLALAVVFVVSAVAKFRDREGSSQAVAAFGVPTALVSLVSRGLPIAELACAILLLLPDPWATVGAASSLTLLVAFTAAIVWNLAQGKHPECHCFGAISGDDGISWKSVARNGVLAALAGLSLVGAGDLRSVPTVLADRPATEGLVLTGFVVLAAATVVMGLALRTLMARYGSVLLRLEALEKATGVVPPQEAPDFRLPDLDDVEVSLADVLSAGRPALIAFISPTCHNCTDLLPDLVRWQSDPDHPFPVVVISDGSVDDIRAKIADSGPLRVLRQTGFSLADAYGILGTPGAVVVGTDAAIAGAPAHSPDAVRAMHDSLVTTMRGGHEHLHQIEQRPVSTGDPVPEVTLRSEDGSAVTAEQALGEEAVLLFWRVDCGFCEQILDEVSVLEQSAPVRLVTGSEIADIRASGLVSPVLRDSDGALERWLRVPGTPSAVRVRDGVLDSSVVVGGPEVVHLLHNSRQPERVDQPG